MNSSKIKSKKFRKGFSLLEVVVATFIFVLMMTALLGIFGSGYSGYRTARAIQKDLEAAQQSMNLIAKTLRTSSVENCASPGPCNLPLLRVYDYSQGKCFVFEFASDNKIKIGSAVPTTPGDKSACPWAAITTADMTTATATGSFYVIPSASTTAGKITISAKICPPTGCTGNPRDQAQIQTTVSLRNYKEVI